MSLTGIVLDVSGSMKDTITSGTDEPGGPWAQSIFKVIDDLIEHDVLSENGVFAIGAGVNCNGKEVFDIIATLQKIQNISYLKQTPASKDNINMICDILEKNGARNIRKWANDISLIRDVVPDHMAVLILGKLESDKQFLTKFVYEFLPPGCQDRIPTASRVNDVENPGLFNFVRRKAANVAEDYAVWVASIFRPRPVRREEILEVVKKSNYYISLQDVSTDSVFSVEEASRVIRGLSEKELSNERKQELLEKVEPFIYGGSTPLFESLEKAIEIFERDTLRENKLLFVLSDGLPTDGSNRDIARINHITSKLRKAGVKIVSCFITRSTHIHPKRLYDEILPLWENGAKFLFSLSSEVPTQLLPRAILVKRGWMIDVANNDMKLFMQVNHPENLREACEMAHDVVCSSDALSELLVSVDLDTYINQTTGPYYVNASATVFHLAMRRILGREGGYPDFGLLKDEMVKAYGDDSADIRQVLQEICPKYRLHCREVFAKGAMEAIVEKRPVVAVFFLTDDEWMAFSNFFEDYPMGILTQSVVNVRRRRKNLPTSGHAVVLTSYNSKCLTFMNSWGQRWGDNGFFRVQNAEVLQLEFFDVFWMLSDLTEGEKEHYHQHGSEVAAKLVNSLKGLQKAEYTCPECRQISLVTEFTGTLSEVQCPKCSCGFSTNDNAGNILALNMYLTSLSR